MSNRAILADGLAKQFKIGGPRLRYQTLRDTITEAAMLPARLGKRLMGNGPGDTSTYIWALNDLSFEIPRGEIVGFIGRNGAGKSTLLKVLSRITEPTRGYAEIHGRVGSLLEVGTGFHPELTGRENTYLSGTILGMKRAEIDRKFDEIVAFAEVEQFIDTPVKHYSSGMYLRMAFAVAAHLDPEILLVDEVLAVGDAAFQKKCLAKMGDVAKRGQTVVFISHNLDAILTLCTSCYVLQSGRLVYQGTPQEAVTAYHRLGFPDDHIDRPAHVLYEAAPPRNIPEAYVNRIEMLDSSLRPKVTLSTWDDVVFRIHYKAIADVHEGSIIFDIRDYKDQRLVVLDSGLNFPMLAGEHYVDCHVPRFPLAAGEFMITAGISNPYVSWIWRGNNIGMLRVYGKDVYELGRPPQYSRMVLAAHCDWEHSNQPAEVPDRRRS